MAMIGDRVLDNGLTILNTEANQLDICSAEPAVYADVATYTLGNKTAPTISVPADATAGGREVTVSAITDGSVTATGTAAFFCLTDTVNLRLLAATALSATQAVTSGNIFTLTALTIGIPDPV